jgi:hypothetical protein
MVQVARMREAAAHGRRLDRRAAAAPGRDPGAPAPWRLPAMVGTAAACLLAFAATFLPVFDGHADSVQTSRIEVVPLPPAQAPESTFDARSALLTHPDFDLLVAAADEAAARDPGFYAWLAAGAKVPEMGADADAAMTPVADAPADPDAPTETEDVF